MQPTITREAFVDRRQPSLRWSAVLAGALCSIAFWILLQLIGVGLGLTTVDAANTRSLHSASVGTSLWSLISPLIATFFGAMIAGRLAQTYDRKLAGAHGLVMWAITSIVGLCATIWIVSMVARGAWLANHGAFDTNDDLTTADRLDAIHDSGKALTIVGCSLLLSLIAAVAGAMAALRRPRGPGDASHRGIRSSTEAGYPPPIEPASTVPYGTPIAAPVSPVPDVPPR
jgi:MFS family permease